MSIYISRAREEHILHYQNGMFVISTTLNVIGLMFLLLQTPVNQAAIRKHLITIQVLLLVSDTHFEIGFNPVSLFPALGGYATGLLIQIGFSLITVILYIWTGMSIIFCVSFRHQTLLTQSSPFKLQQRTIRIIRATLIAVPTCITLVYLFRVKDAATVDRLLLEDSHNLTWVRDRGAYYIERRTPLLKLAITTCICLLICGCLGVSLIFVHMFYVLRQDKAKRSLQSVNVIRRSLTALFLQLVCPLFLFAVPILTILLALAIPDMLSFVFYVPQGNTSSTIIDHSLKMDCITVPFTVFAFEQAQEQIFHYLNALFLLSTVLNVVGLLFLVIKTPHNKATIRNHLILIQVLLFINDIHLDVGYRVIPLFPALAAYATGLLIQMGATVHVEFSATIIFYVWIGISILVIKRFALRRNTRIIQCMLFVVTTFPAVVYAFNGRDAADIEHILNEILIVAALAAILLFVHMFYVLQKDSGKRSAQSIQAIRRSLIALFLQLNVPIGLFIFPTVTIFLGLAIEDLFSFGDIIFSILPWHSVGHNLILLMITPIYRNLILTGFKNIIMCRLSTFFLPMSIYLPLSTQEHIFYYLNVMFGISATLNVIGLMFLLLQTPINQAAIRKYLVIIQVLLLISDTHLDIAFHPVPLFPALAGYATGLLIQIGFSVHLELLITIILYIWIGVSIICCIMFRHQTLLSEGSPFKLKQTTVRIIRTTLIVVPTGLILFYLFRVKNSATNTHNLTWIRDRGSYYVERRTTLLIFAITAVICLLISGSLGVLLIFGHMFYVLRHDKAKRSWQSINVIRRSLRALFLFQLVCPLFLFIVPMEAILLALAIPDLFSFEVLMAFFLVLPWHSVGHNLLLLTLTSTYRNAIASYVKSVISCRSSTFFLLMTIYLPLSIQEQIFVYQNVMFVISTALNVIGLMFLLKQTPLHQAKIRNYLILIQAIPLFPAFAGYAVGMLIQIGFTVHLEFAITIIFYVWIGLSILVCVLYRHQTICLEGNTFKLKQRTLWIGQCMLFVVPTIPAVVYAFNGRDAADMEQFLNEDSHNITWIRERGSFYVEKRTPLITAGILLVLGVLVAGTLGGLLIYFHMFYVLQQDVSKTRKTFKRNVLLSGKRSSQGIQAIRRSLIALFLQLDVPLALFIFPTATIFSGLVIEDFLSFEVMMAVFLVLPWHSVGHNLMLLMITPIYRNRILNCFKYIAKCIRYLPNIQSLAMSIYIPLSTEREVLSYLNIMFACATTLNVVGLLFLLRETPPNQSSIRNYLILRQVLLMVNDVHFEIGFRPIPLFPALAGYAVGVLIRMGCTVHHQFVLIAVTIILHIWMGMSMLVSTFHRHQSICLEGNAMKFRQKTVRIIEWTLFVAPMFPPVVYALYGGNDEAEMDDLILKDSHNITWVRERASYYVTKRTPYIMIAIVLVIALLILGALTAIYIFVQMFRILQQDSAKRSLHSIHVIRRSLRALLFLFIAPFVLFVFPAVTIFVGLAFEDLLSHEVMMAAFLVVPWHSVGHNTILLSITPVYRKRIASCLANFFTLQWMQIYLPPSTQEQIFVYLNVMFAISTILNVIGLTFLLKQTPLNQAGIRNYLILIQVLLIVNDFHLDVGLRGIPLFPALGGYAVGLLIQIGLTAHVEFSITIILYVWIGASILVCDLYRHQTICMKGNALKLKQDSHNITWIRDRGSYYVEKRTPEIMAAIILVLTALIVGTLGAILLFAHMSHYLSKWSNITPKPYKEK